ncbi:hypothetical protein ACJX0J_040348, partial [Zea mays]
DLRTGEVIGTGRRRKAAPRLYILDSLRLPSLATSPAHVTAYRKEEREKSLLEKKMTGA